MNRYEHNLAAKPVEERDLRFVESLLEDADGKAAGAIAFAALCRVGELGESAAGIVADLASLADGETLGDAFAAGLEEIEAHRHTPTLRPIPGAATSII